MHENVLQALKLLKLFYDITSLLTKAHSGSNKSFHNEQQKETRAPGARGRGGQEETELEHA